MWRILSSYITAYNKTYSFSQDSLMDSEDFWKHYASPEEIIRFSDEAIATFRQPFPVHIYEEYDVGEVVTEFSGHHQTAKQYDKIAEFRRVVKEHHPSLYADEHVYLNDALIIYYCFRQDADALLPSAEDFCTYPVDGDHLESSVKRLMYHNFGDLADRIIQAKYEEVKQNDDLSDVAQELSILKYYRLLEELVQDARPEALANRWPSLQQAAKPYDFELKEEQREIIFRGLTEQPSAYAEHLTENPQIRSNRARSVNTLEVFFLRTMRERGFSFPVSGTIWTGLSGLWNSNEASSWPEHFHFDETSLRLHVREFFGFMVDLHFEAALILWGSSHVIDFLRDIDLLNEDAYAAQQTAIAQVKEGFKRDFASTLWEYNLVHDAPPPRGISEDAWQQEHQLFTDSYEQDEREEFINFNSRYFYEPGPLFPSLFPEPFDPVDPVRVGPKIGRNDRVTVKYTDGTMKESIKYKKIVDDLEAGRCELM